MEETIETTANLNERLTAAYEEYSTADADRRRAIVLAWEAFLQKSPKNTDECFGNLVEIRRKIKANHRAEDLLKALTQNVLLPQLRPVDPTSLEKSLQDDYKVYYGNRHSSLHDAHLAALRWKIYSRWVNFFEENPSQIESCIITLLKIDRESHLDKDFLRYDRSSLAVQLLLSVLPNDTHYLEQTKAYLQQLLETGKALGLHNQDAVQFAFRRVDIDPNVSANFERSFQEDLTDPIVRTPLLNTLLFYLAQIDLEGIDLDRTIQFIMNYIISDTDLSEDEKGLYALLPRYNEITSIQIRVKIEALIMQQKYAAQYKIYPEFEAWSNLPSADKKHLIEEKLKGHKTEADLKKLFSDLISVEKIDPFFMAPGSFLTILFDTLNNQERKIFLDELYDQKTPHQIQEIFRHLLLSLTEPKSGEVRLFRETPPTILDALWIHHLELLAEKRDALIESLIPQYQNKLNPGFLAKQDADARLRLEFTRYFFWHCKYANLTYPKALELAQNFLTKYHKENTLPYLVNIDMDEFFARHQIHFENFYNKLLNLSCQTQTYTHNDKSFYTATTQAHDPESPHVGISQDAVFFSAELPSTDLLTQAERAQVLEETLEELQALIANAHKEKKHSGGSTLTLCLVADTVDIAHIGDSRAVKVLQDRATKQLRCEQITEPHSSKQRINSSDGQSLNLTHTMGDIRFHEEKLVSHDPDILPNCAAENSYETLQGIILATDGLDNLGDFQKCLEGETLNIAEALVERAIQEGSLDDCSAAYIPLETKPGKPILVGIADGHGPQGEFVSKLIQENASKILARKLSALHTQKIAAAKEHSAHHFLARTTQALIDALPFTDSAEIHHKKILACIHVLLENDFKRFSLNRNQDSRNEIRKDWEDFLAQHPQCKEYFLKILRTLHEAEYSVNSELEWSHDNFMFQFMVYKLARRWTAAENDASRQELINDLRDHSPDVQRFVKSLLSFLIQQEKKALSLFDESNLLYQVWVAHFRTRPSQNEMIKLVLQQNGNDPDFPSNDSLLNALFMAEVKSTYNQLENKLPLGQSLMPIIWHLKEAGISAEKSQEILERFLQNNQTKLRDEIDYRFQTFRFYGFFATYYNSLDTEISTRPQQPQPLSSVGCATTRGGPLGKYINLKNQDTFAAEPLSVDLDKHTYEQMEAILKKTCDALQSKCKSENEASTGNICIVRKDKFTVATVGDSPVLRVTRNKKTAEVISCEQISTPHNFEDINELARIGEQIDRSDRTHRVRGTLGLNYTRAFGAAEHSELTKPDPSYCDGEKSKDPNEETFVILATDGLSEATENKHAFERYIKNKLSGFRGTPEQMAVHLTRQARDDNSRDNITVVVMEVDGKTTAMGAVFDGAGRRGRKVSKLLKERVFKTLNANITNEPKRRKEIGKDINTLLKETQKFHKDIERRLKKNINEFQKNFNALDLRKISSREKINEKIKKLLEDLPRDAYVLIEGVGTSEIREVTAAENFVLSPDQLETLKNIQSLIEFRDNNSEAIALATKIKDREQLLVQLKDLITILKAEPKTIVAQHPHVAESPIESSESPEISDEQPDEAQALPQEALRPEPPVNDVFNEAKLRLYGKAVKQHNLIEQIQKYPNSNSQKFLNVLYFILSIATLGAGFLFFDPRKSRAEKFLQTVDKKIDNVAVPVTAPAA